MQNNVFGRESNSVMMPVRNIIYLYILVILFWGSTLNVQVNHRLVIITRLVESHKSSSLCLHSFSEPSFGHFNKDNVLDVVIEEDVSNYTKRVRVL